MSLCLKKKKFYSDLFDNLLDMILSLKENVCECFVGQLSAIPGKMVENVEWIFSWK